MWIGISTSGLTTIVMLFTADFNSISAFFKYANSNDFLNSSGIVILGVIMYTIMPFYINKCSSFVLMLSLNSQLYWKFVIEIIFFNFDVKLLWTTFGLIILLVGIGLYLFDLFQTKVIIVVRGPLFDSILDANSMKPIIEDNSIVINRDKVKENANLKQDENKANEQEEDDINEITVKDKTNTQKLFIDTGDKASECSAFSYSSGNENLLNIK